MRSLTNIRRMIFGVVIICFLGLSAFGAPRQYIISGFVQTSGGSGVEGVSVVGDNGAGSAVTDADGAYSITVPNNWSGTITVSKAGWLITPASKTYIKIRENKANENYIAYQPKISGYVKKADGTALSSATVSASGGASTTTNSSGYYEIIVPYGWTGTLSAALAGYGFTAKSYTNVTIDQANQNFTGYQPKISGYVKKADGTALSGASVSASGGASTTTNSSGYYEIIVPYGWTGTLSAALAGYGFTAKSYTNVTIDQANQNFTGYQPKISGYVKKADGTALSGASVSASGGASTTTNSSGYYEIIVPYNWSGLVTAQRAAWQIIPEYYSYDNLTVHQSNQDFAAFYTGIINVKPDGMGDYPTIQAAIDAAANGDVVVLQPGTYTGTGNRDIDFKGKAITVRGATGDANDCIIDCQGTEAEPHRGFKFVSGEDNNSVLEAITVTNGYRSHGGAIYTYNSSPSIQNCTIKSNSGGTGAGIKTHGGSPSIYNCIIIDNNAVVDGGGFNCESGSPTIINCTISGNSARRGSGLHLCQHCYATVKNCLVVNNSASDKGGGICVSNSNPIITNCSISNNSTHNSASTCGGGAIYNYYYSSPTISNCDISNNSANYAGGGIYNYNKSRPTIRNCIISNNSASKIGGGVYNNDSSPYISNCIISNNSATSNGGGVYTRYYSSASIKNSTIRNNSATTGSGIESDTTSSSYLYNCIIWSNLPWQINGNANLSYCDIQGGYSGVGNINVDPCFVDDYHISLDSPCINTGDPNYIGEPNETDIDGDPRIVRTRVDIGADELLTQNPFIMLSMEDLSFTALEGRGNPGPGIVKVNNFGINNLNWTANANVGWLTITPFSGCLAYGQTDTLSISANISGMPAGEYSGHISIEDPQATNNPQIIDVNMVIIGPSLGVSQNNFNFQASKVVLNPAPQVLTISNVTGGGTLLWHILPDCNWMIIEPVTGAITTGSEDIILDIDQDSIEYGTHSCQLTIEAPDAQNSPQVVTVNLEVLEPQIGVNNDYFYFTAYGKSDDVAEQELIITNTGFDTLNWHIEIPDCNWLSVAPQSGQVTDGSSVVAISVDPTKVPAYGYNYAMINIIDENASNSPQAVTVRLRVLGPSIYVNLYGLIYAERNTKVEKTFEIINTGYDILHWNIETPNDCNWLEIVEPLSGECAAEESDIVTVTVDANGLEENNDYSTRLLIHSPECESRRVDFKLIVYTSNEIHVPQDYPTIQEAVNAALTGDIIIVHPGRYAGFDVDKPVLTIRSIEPENPAVVAATIIESGGYVHGNYGNEAVINGLSFIYNPAVPDQSENGIYISKSSDVQIKNCRVLNFPGAGICVSERNPTTGTISISNCVISNNGYLGWGWYYYPGGIIISGSANIENCLITGNFGGGILVAGPSELGGCKIYIRNNTIADNFFDITKTSGRGITCSYYYHYYLGLTLSLQNSITSNAVGPNDVEIFISAEDDPDPNNINFDAAYSNIRGGLAAVSMPIGANVVWGQSNIDADPCFVEPGYWVDANDPNIIVEPNDPNAIRVDGDYHLKSEGWRWDAQRKVWKWDDVTSRCIDAGNPGCPLGEELLSVPDDPDNKWGQNLRINMGAYGGTAEASMPPYDWALLGDLTNDGKVGLNDLAAFVDYWPDSGECIPSDLNRNQFVDFVDFALLGQDWFLETSWYRP